jgi:hypothetical protein
MIIELENKHVKWSLLIEETCVLPVNRKVTMWIRTLLRVYSRVTNKGEIYCIDGLVIVKLCKRDIIVVYSYTLPCGNVN